MYGGLDLASGPHIDDSCFRPITYDNPGTNPVTYVFMAVTVLHTMATVEMERRASSNKDNGCYLWNKRGILLQERVCEDTVKQF